jgi:LysR family glycine cleavage system transcriptional activator
MPRLGAFQAAHPQIDIRLAASDRVVDLAQEGVDLAIRYSAATNVAANAVKLFDEVVVPVASPSVGARAFAHPDALAQHILLDFDVRGRPWLHWSTWLKTQEREQKPKGYLHFNQYDQVIQAAIEGHGVALGRLALVLPMLSDGRLVAQIERRMLVEGYGYWLIEASEQPRPEVAVFRDWLTEQVASTAQQLAE